MFDNRNIININKYYANNLNFDKYKYYNNYYNDNDKYYNNTYNINDEHLYRAEKNISKKQSKYQKDFISIDEIDDNEIKKFLNTLTIEELYRLIKLLLEYKPINEEQKEKIQQIFKKFKFLIEQRISLEEQNIFDAKSSELMNEISDILGIKVGTKNADADIALYMYMSLVFSQNNEIDYSHICLRNLFIDVNPYKYVDKDIDNGNLSDSEKQKRNKIINFEKNYTNIKNYINKLYVEFSKNMDTKIESYHKNPNEKFKHSLMNEYVKFYNSIMDSMDNRNQLVLTSIRNSVEHGNYYVNKNGSLILYDQTDHNDNKCIKFLCGTSPQQLFGITKTIELSDSKDKYIMDDFFKELETIINKTTLTNIMNTMNNFSKIIFGKDIDINNSMEHMYQEALASILSQAISKK